MNRTTYLVLVTLALYGASAAAQSPSNESSCPSEGRLNTAARLQPRAAHGVQELGESAVLVVPDGVTSLTVELWGAGGGGGGGSIEAFSTGGAGGGGGAAGSYLRAIVAVTPGSSYTIVVGTGGSGGHGGTRSNGEAGGETWLCDGSRIALRAPGGSGGAAAPRSSDGGSGGRGRSPAESANVAAVRRAGSDGASGIDPLFERGGTGGVGGQSVRGSVQPVEAFGGSGGAGAFLPDAAKDGAPGGRGSVIVSW